MFLINLNFYSMRKFLTLAVALLSGACMAFAGTTASGTATNDSVPNIVEELTSTGKVTIVQPPALLKRLQSGNAFEKQAETTQPSSVKARTISGFRVEVFADNNVRTAKSKASQKRALLMSRFPSHRVYLTFESPFWRVRVGDFKNRGAADACMAEIRQAIPSIGGDLRVVRCTINNH